MKFEIVCFCLRWNKFLWGHRGLTPFCPPPLMSVMPLRQNFFVGFGGRNIVMKLFMPSLKVECALNRKKILDTPLMFLLYIWLRFFFLNYMNTKLICNYNQYGKCLSALIKKSKERSMIYFKRKFKLLPQGVSYAFYKNR